MTRIFTLGSILVLFLTLTVKAEAATVYCTNCSTEWTQALERGTSLEQLRTMLSSYHEAIMQTTQQIELVRNNIQQYQNMLKNTLALPGDLINQVKGEFTRLAKLTNEISGLKADVLATGEVFDELYPELDMIKSMAGGDVSASELWERWSKESDSAARATFQVTGSQLKDLAENSEALDRQIDNLLSTPEGQMQAIQSGNSLAAMQVSEMRQLRALMAVSIQAAVQAQQKDAKKAQADKAFMDQVFDSEAFKSPMPYTK